MLYGRHLDFVNRRRISVAPRIYLFCLILFLSPFIIIGVLTRENRLFTLRTEELLTLPEHPISSTPTPLFSRSHNKCSVRLYFIMFSSEFMFYLCHLYLIRHNDVQQDFHIKWCWCRLKVTRHVPHQEQELLTLTEFTP